MEGYQIGELVQDVKQNGNIAVARNDFRIAGNDRIIEKRQNTGYAHASSRRENHVDVRILDHAHEIGCALLIRAGEISVCGIDVSS